MFQPCLVAGYVQPQSYLFTWLSRKTSHFGMIITRDVPTNLSIRVLGSGSPRLIGSEMMKKNGDKTEKSDKNRHLNQKFPRVVGFSYRRRFLFIISISMYHLSTNFSHLIVHETKHINKGLLCHCPILGMGMFHWFILSNMIIECWNTYSCDI